MSNSFEIRDSFQFKLLSFSSYYYRFFSLYYYVFGPKLEDFYEWLERELDSISRMLYHEHGEVEFEYESEYITKEIDLGNVLIESNPYISLSGYIQKNLVFKIKNLNIDLLEEKAIDEFEDMIPNFHMVMLEGLSEIFDEVLINSKGVTFKSENLKQDLFVKDLKNKQDQNKAILFCLTHYEKLNAKTLYESWSRKYLFY